MRCNQGNPPISEAEYTLIMLGAASSAVHIRAGVISELWYKVHSEPTSKQKQVEVNTTYLTRFDSFVYLHNPLFTH